MGAYVPSLPRQYRALRRSWLTRLLTTALYAVGTSGTSTGPGSGSPASLEDRPCCEVLRRPSAAFLQSGADVPLVTAAVAGCLQDGSSLREVPNADGGA
jgi:hypothetical protein